MFTYDHPLMITRSIGDVTFASHSPVTHITNVVVSRGDLTACQLLAVEGFVGTAGTGQIKIGDGTKVDRYGVVDLVSSAVDGPISGKITLTEEGAHMGVQNGNAPDTFVLTFSGSIVVEGLNIIVGHFA